LFVYISGIPETWEFVGEVRRVNSQIPDPDWDQRFRLIGLVHGHWDVKNIPEPFLRDMNEGIVNVVPAQKILDVLDRPELCEIRDRFGREKQTMVKQSE